MSSRFSLPRCLSPFLFYMKLLLHSFTLRMLSSSDRSSIRDMIVYRMPNGSSMLCISQEKNAHFRSEKCQRLLASATIIPGFVPSLA